MPNKDPNAELEPPNRRPGLCLNLRQVEQFGQGIPPRRGRVRFPERRRMSPKKLFVEFWSMARY
jgi:hypothetical protein